MPVPFQYDPYGEIPIDEKGGPSNPAVPSQSLPGGGFGAGGSLYGGIGYDPTSPIFGRRRKPGANPFASLVGTGGGVGAQTPMSPMRGGPVSPEFFGGPGTTSPVNPFNPFNPLNPLSPRSPGPAGEPTTWGGYNPYQGDGDFSARQLIQQILQRGLGAGYLDPTGEGPLLKLLQQESIRDLGASQSGDLAFAQASGADPAQIASAALEGGLRNRGATSKLLSGARLDSAQQSRSLMEAIIQALLGAEGVQRIGKYDASRSGTRGPNISIGLPGLSFGGGD